MTRSSLLSIVAGVMMAWLVTGCRHAPTESVDLNVAVAYEPSPPVKGPAKVTVTVTDAAGSAVEHANVQVEGNMNHAGMKPSLATLEEVAPGQYEGSLQFTMSGDWFLLVNVTTPTHGSTVQKVDVPGVTSQ